MNKINVEEIFEKHGISISAKGFNNFNGKVKEAIKEIVELAIDKCVEEGEKYEEENVGMVYLDKESILQVKQMIDYEW